MPGYNEAGVLTEQSMMASRLAYHTDLGNIQALPVTVNELLGTAATASAQMVDNSGGTAGSSPFTIAAITTGGGTYPDATPTKNAIAMLAAQVNLLQSAISNSRFADRGVMLEGTNAVSSNATNSALGGWTLTTTAAASDQMIISPRTSSPFITLQFNTSRRPRIEAVIKTGAAITNTTIWWGFKLTNTPVVATDDDQAFFRYADGTASGVWQCINSTGGTDQTQNTTVTVAVSTVYQLVVEVGADLKPRYYIGTNGGPLSLVATGAALTSALTTLKLFCGIQTSTGARAIDYINFAAGQDITTSLTN